MSISIEQGFSISLPVVVTNGPIPTLDETTPLSSFTAGTTGLALVYPDPTPGVANPARSIRVDAKAPGLSSVFYSCDGHNSEVLAISVTAPVNRGTSGFGTPSAPFLTPTA